MYRMNSPSEWSVIERSALFLALILIIIIGLKMIEFIFNLLLISLHPDPDDNPRHGLA